MKIASYKATRPGIAGLFNIGVRWWRASHYSHNELVFSDGRCASFSWLDHGARIKSIDLNPEKWDFAEVPAGIDEASARAWFESRIASQDRRKRRYNVWLLVAFVLPFLARRAAKLGHVCSTGIAEALGHPEPWRIDPALLHALYAHTAPGHALRDGEASPA